MKEIAVQEEAKEVKMERLVARREFRYEGRQLHVGEEFNHPANQTIALIAAGFAESAKQKEEDEEEQRRSSGYNRRDMQSTNEPPKPTQQHDSATSTGRRHNR